VLGVLVCVVCVYLTIDKPDTIEQKIRIIALFNQCRPSDVRCLKVLKHIR
jgi:hypothetical protein